MNRPTGPHFRSRLLAGPWVYFGLYTIWLAVTTAGDSTRGTLNDLLFLPLYVGAGMAAVAASRTEGMDPLVSRGWRLVGGAWLFSGLGAAFWLVNRWADWPPLDWSGGSPTTSTSRWSSSVCGRWSSCRRGRRVERGSGSTS